MACRGPTSSGDDAHSEEAVAVSVHAMSWAWKQDLKAPEKLVLLALADHSDDKGKCWPGMTGIAKKCGLSRRSVIDVIKRLEQAKLIKVKKRKRDDGSNSSNLYVLDFTSSENTAPHGEGNALDSAGNNTRGGEGAAPESINRNHQNKPNAHFATFWSAYPKKKDKGKTEKAFYKIKPSDDLMKTILAALEVQKHEWKDEQFIPYPASWLNGKRWEDETPQHSSPTQEHIL